MNILNLTLIFAITIFVSCAIPVKEQDTHLAGDAATELERKPPAHNLMLDIPIETLARRADLIVYGHVENVEGNVENLSDDIRMPISTVTLQVTKVLKGDAGREVVFKSLGAVIDGLPYFSEEMAQFVKGESVAVFLADFGGTILPVGHAQGKISVSDDPVTQLTKDISVILKE